ncbi:DMT family transporter [Brachyspira sp.]|uniref:DMT family transporter n=1 Tax=Brachyspira sp. TaxID=1977261 RepID=UPI002627515E|nr:DMT family transporter [Brachyspira sp.]
MFNVLLVIIGSIAYGFLPIFVKNIIPYGYSSLSIVFYRYFFTVIFLFIIILITKKSFKITKKQFIELLIFSITGLGLTFFFLSKSLLYISAGLSNMIHFGYPVVVLLVMIFMFKEKANILKILSIIFAVVGIVLLTQVVKVDSFLGIIYALITTVTYGAYIVANKRCSFSEVDTIVSMFYMSLFVSVSFFIVGIITNSLQLLNNLYVFSNFVVISLVCTIFSLGLLLYGVKRLGSSLASILNMFEPATTVVTSVFLYKEELTFNIIIGSTLIILSTISMVIGSKK